ncbi:MAG: hypothetical protein K2X32_00165, partial [Phycisphaerales bacterium]|nr:hypothetical protein [Phycisphaerales bacterium]
MNMKPRHRISSLVLVGTIGVSGFALRGAMGEPAFRETDPETRRGPAPVMPASPSPAVPPTDRPPGTAPGKERTMKPPVTPEIKLATNEVVRGESVYFLASAINTLQTAAHVQSFHRHNRALGIEAKGAEGTFRGKEMTRQTKPGAHFHGPENKHKVTIPPGGAISLADDMLLWTGELPSASYEVRAYYGGPWEDHYASKPVKLNVLPVNLRLIASARLGARSPMAPIPGAFVHQTAQGQFAVFLQQQWPQLPPMPMHGVKVATLPTEPTVVATAAAVDPEPPVGQVLWSQGGKWMMATVDFGPSPTKAMPAPPAPPVPFVPVLEGGPLRS